MNEEETLASDDDTLIDGDAQVAYDPDEDLFYEDGLEDEGDLDYEPEYADY